MPALVREVTDADARLELLLASVEVLAATGREAEAGELIRATPEPEQRGRAWAVLAENLIGDQVRQGGGPVVSMGTMDDRSHDIRPSRT